MMGPSRCQKSLLVRAKPHRSEEHTSELQSQSNLVCRLLLEKKKKSRNTHSPPTAVGENNAPNSRLDDRARRPCHSCSPLPTTHTAACLSASRDLRVRTSQPS